MCLAAGRIVLVERKASYPGMAGSGAQGHREDQVITSSPVVARRPGHEVNLRDLEGSRSRRLLEDLGIVPREPNSTPGAFSRCVRGILPMATRQSLGPSGFESVEVHRTHRQDAKTSAVEARSRTSGSVSCGEVTMWESTSKVLCRMTGHIFGTLMQRGIGSRLCSSCDTVVYDDIIKHQGKEWGKKKYADRHKKDGQK